MPTISRFMTPPKTHTRTYTFTIPKPKGAEPHDPALSNSPSSEQAYSAATFGA